MPDKTYAQLTAATDLQDADLIATYRPSTSGPLKTILFSLLKSSLLTYFTGQFLTGADNLASLVSKATARTNLGLGGAATLNVGAITGTVAAGDDARFATAQAAMPVAGGNFTGPIGQNGAGGYLYNAANASGLVTVSTAAPSGGNNGDIWLQTT